jgi:TolB-like protein/Flp pilus assembly protein TadD
MQPSEVDVHAARLQLERILASETFNRNERLSQFLRFVVERHIEGGDNHLKESVIAVEVFGRRADYDPKLDSIVRTEAGRLRARLADYYARDGILDEVIIEVPKGGYTPCFRRRPTEGEGPKSRSGRFAFPAIAAALLLVLGLIGGWRWFHGNSEPITIAVLPLENLGHDPANDYFTDGLTDEIINNLSVIEGLVVRSRTSSFALKGTSHNVREAGKQLQADYVLEGSVLRAVEKLRVNAQLVRVRDDFPLWSGKFDRELTDVFAIQDEISLGVVNGLRLKLGRGRRRYEISVEAYDLYLRARSLAIRHSRPPDEAIGLFRQASAKDPSFAPAYAGLAAAYASGSVAFPRNHPADELAKMRAAAEKAIQLDPLLAEAYDALGLVYARDGQWEQAEKTFRHAIELDSNRSTTYVYFAWVLSVLGRLDDARQQLRLAEKLDPLSPDVYWRVADVLLSEERPDEAAAYCLKLPGDDPKKSECLARVRLGQGRTAEAVQILASDPTLLDPQSRGFLGYAYARSGRLREAEELLDDDAKYPNEQTLVFAGLGDKERTFEALDRMATLGAERVGQYLNFPELAFLRHDPRLKTFRMKVGLQRQ